MGGPIVTRFSNMNPKRVKRLALLDPMVFTPANEDIIEDAGHIAHFERPEILNPLLINFLSQPLP